jgi:hypothetical protein
MRILPGHVEILIEAGLMTKEGGCGGVIVVVVVGS